MKTRNQVLSMLFLIPLFMFTACAQTTKKQGNTKKTVAMENTIKKPGKPYYSNTDTTKLNVSDAEWKKVLPEDVYEVTRNADTERPFTGKYWNTGYDQRR